MPRGGAGTRLTGLAEFRVTAESHRGLCHGGSMCAVMDDIIGWCAFCVTGTVVPWSGYTVQVNTSLRAPVKVNSTLQLTATIDKVQGRKVHVTATLVDPNSGKSQAEQDDDDTAVVVHAACEGLVILNRGVLLPSNV
jgi:acyl-coenzyme A thioesterase PaaI-like protein